MRTLHLPLLLLLQLLTGARSRHIAPATAQRLYRNLTTDYDPWLRPTHDQSQQVSVYAAVFPYTVLELSTSDQRLTMMLYVSFVWKDQFLVWNSTLYDGIQKVTLTLHQIWHPKLLLGVTYTDKTNTLGDSADQVTVESNGTVVWSTVSAVPVLCVVDIAFYPFDTQECSITISPTYTSLGGFKFYMPGAHAQHGLMQENPEWHLLETQSVVIDTEEKGNIIIYTYLFRRRAMFVVYTIVVPLVMLSVLNACVVLVPVSSGEKGSIAVTLFLSYCVYLTAIGETLPSNSSKTSYLLLYMTIVQAFSALTMLYCIIQTRLFIHGSKHFKSCMSGILKYSESNNKDARKSNIAYVEDTCARDAFESKHVKTEEPCSDEGLDVHRRLDNVAFVTCLVLNAVVVVAFAILTTNSIQNKLE